MKEKSVAKIREFPTGATRDTDEGKYDYEGFFSPLVLERRAQYMHKHRKQSDGQLRDSDNWQKGISFSVYMKSGMRHFMDWWLHHREVANCVGSAVLQEEQLEEALCALLFNCEGYLLELLKEKEL